MRFTYDTKSDALTVELGGGRTVQTVQIGPGISADLDREGRLVCIEILAASAWYPRVQLERLAAPIELITTGEAARDSGLPPSTIRRQILAGRIPGARKDGFDWLLPRQELWNFLRRLPEQPHASRRHRRRGEGSAT